MFIFTKLSVQKHNQEALFNMPGELLSFNATDEGDVSGISSPADVKLTPSETWCESHGSLECVRQS